VRHLVLPMADLDQRVTLSYRLAGTDQEITVELEMPTEYGQSDEVTLQALIQEVAEVEGRASDVRSAATAAEAREELRGLSLRILAHPLTDSPIARASLIRVRQSMEGLERLERGYTEELGAVVRKARYQSRHNLEKPLSAFSPTVEESLLFASGAVANSPITGPLGVDPAALALAPIERWRAWRAVPISTQGGRLIVLLENPKDGFKLAEIEQATGMRVRPLFRPVSADEIDQLLG
jgi:hypothetical protein